MARTDRRHVLDRRLRPRGGAVGRLGAVEVPVRRLRRPLGRAARRRDRDAGVREPALRAERARAPARGALGPGGRRPADGRGRRPRPPAARSRRRPGQRGDVHRPGVHGLGRRAHREPATRRRATSSSTRRPSTRWPRRSRRRAGKPLAVRLIDCLAAAQEAGGDSRGQQSSALLVVERDGGYARHVGRRRRAPRRGPRAADRGAAPHLHAARRDLRRRRRAHKWLDVDDELAAELRERLAKLGYDGELEDAFTRWTGKENLEDRVDGIEQIDPVVLEALRSRT